MQTHNPTHLRVHRRASERFCARTPWRKLLAGVVSATLCLGMVPIAPAWGDEVSDDTAETPAAASVAASPEADASTNADAAGTPDATDAATSDATEAAMTDAAAAALQKAAAAATAAEPAAESADDADDESADDNAAADATDGDTTIADNPDESTAIGETVEQYFPTDKTATAKLLKKLTARFSADGDDGKLSATTVDAAIALNALGKGADIDTDALIKNLAKDEQADGGLTLGQYGRYIMALTAGGIDCTKVSVDGKTRNLVTEMEKLSETTDPTLEDVVYMLPVYGNDNYRNTSGLTPEGLIDLLLDAQDEDGFFWPSEDADTYSIPLTSQALLALLPYAEDDDDVAAAVEDAGAALYDAQLIDGSWPADGLALDGDVPATAYATTALVALGADPNTDLKTSNDSTPLGYLTAHADEALDGYDDLDGLEKGAEPSTSAAVLMALAANEGYDDTEEAFDVYDVREVKRPATTTAANKTTTTTPSSSYTSTAAAKTIPQSGDELPWTMGFTAAAGAFALGAAVLARRRMREH